MFWESSCSAIAVLSMLEVSIMNVWYSTSARLLDMRLLLTRPGSLESGGKNASVSYVNTHTLQPPASLTTTHTRHSLLYQVKLHTSWLLQDGA